MPPVARCLQAGAEGVRGDWWEARYEAATSAPWARSTTFAALFEDAVSKRGAVSPAGRQLSDISFSASFLMNRDGLGCDVPPSSMTIPREVFATYKLPAYSAGGLEEALGLATVNGDPFGALPWHRPAFEREFPAYFAGRGSGSKGGSKIFTDATTTVELSLVEVEYRTNSLRTLAGALPGRTIAPQPSIQPTSRTLDRQVDGGTALTVPADRERLELSDLPDADPAVVGGDSGGGPEAEAVGSAPAPTSSGLELGPGAVALAAGIGIALLARR